MQRNRGFSTILMSVVVLIAVTMSSFMAANRIINHQSIITTKAQHIAAFQIAQAGLDYATVHLTANYDSIVNGQTVQVALSAQRYFVLTYTFVDGKDLIRVQSVGYLTDASSQIAADHTLQQTVSYQGSSSVITGDYALQTRTNASAKNNAIIYNLSGGLYTARVGEDITFANNARTELATGPGSSNYLGIQDDVQFDPNIASMTNDEMQTNFLGAPITDYQVASTTYNLPMQSGNHSYNSDLQGMTGVGISLTQSGGEASFKNNSWTGAENDPIVLVVNLSNGAKFSLSNNVDVYGKIVANGGSVEIGNNAQLVGDLIVDGDLELGNNVTVDGDVIVTGNVELNNNARVNGTLFALGDVEMQNNVEVHGAVVAGGEVTMRNNAKIIYNATNAAVTIPGASGTPSYARVMGSWSDF